MRGQDNLHESLHSRGPDRLHVAFQQRLERLFRLPLRVFRRQFLHPIEGEQDLRVHGVFDPQRAVIVEGGNTRLGRDIVRTALLRHVLDKLHEGLLGFAVIPGGQRIADLRGRRSQKD
jgi:hypothetical protein